MATVTEIPLDLERMRQNRGWFIALGVILILIGGFAITCPFIAELAFVSVFGWMLIFSGTIQAIFSAQMREWSGVALNLVSSILEIIVGILCIRHPGEGVTIFSLLLIVYLMVSGIFRIVASFTLKIPGAGWLALSGLVSAGLGGWLLYTFGTSVFWLLGTFVGVDLIFHGVSWITLAMALKKSASV